MRSRSLYGIESFTSCTWTDRILIPVLRVLRVSEYIAPIVMEDIALLLSEDIVPLLSEDKAPLLSEDIVPLLLKDIAPLVSKVRSKLKIK